MTDAILVALSIATQTYGLPPGLLSAVCYVESKHQPQYYINYNDGDGHSLGECQVKLETAKMMGYRWKVAPGQSEEEAEMIAANRLRDNVKLNTKYAAKYLKYQLDRYKGDIPKAIAAYNAGTYRTNKKGLTLNRKYVNKVMKAWSEGL